MKNKIILHRGYKGKYPENSKISIMNAIQENLPTEIDIRVSKDNVPFIIHDDSIDRLFNGSGRIRYHDSSYLKRFQYQIEPDEKLLTLKKISSLLNKEHPDIFIHIKNIADIKPTISILRDYNLIKNINFFACDSLTMDFIQLMKNKYPEYKVGLHFYENSPFFNKTCFETADFIWADEINFKWITEDKVELAQKLNKPFYAISPELIEESVFNKDINLRWNELLELGVDKICTDKPKEFLNLKKI
jgi:glycerophosphoryl diester phosphodiesterase